MWANEDNVFSWVDGYFNVYVFIISWFELSSNKNEDLMVDNIKSLKIMYTLWKYVCTHYCYLWLQSLFSLVFLDINSAHCLLSPTADCEALANEPVEVLQCPERTVQRVADRNRMVASCQHNGWSFNKEDCIRIEIVLRKQGNTLLEN